MTENTELLRSVEEHPIVVSMFLLCNKILMYFASIGTKIDAWHGWPELGFRKYSGNRKSGRSQSLHIFPYIQFEILKSGNRKSGSCEPSVGPAVEFFRNFEILGEQQRWPSLPKASLLFYKTSSGTRSSRFWLNPFSRKTFCKFGNLPNELQAQRVLLLWFLKSEMINVDVW